MNQIAEVLQLAHLLERRPEAFPGGRRQRMTAGCTLIVEPRVSLLDEPPSSPDAALCV